MKLHKTSALCIAVIASQTVCAAPYIRTIQKAVTHIQTSVLHSDLKITPDYVLTRESSSRLWTATPRATGDLAARLRDVSTDEQNAARKAISAELFSTSRAKLVEAGYVDPAWLEQHREPSVLNVNPRLLKGAPVLSLEFMK